MQSLEHKLNCGSARRLRKNNKVYLKKRVMFVFDVLTAEAGSWLISSIGNIATAFIRCFATTAIQFRRLINLIMEW